MERYDVYDKNRNKTGRTHERGTPVNPGDYHIVVHVWIFNDNGEFLIQKRQSWKKGWPNMWDCSAAGCAIVDDDSKSAAIRETKEELGVDIDLTNEEVAFTINFPTGFDDIWIIKQNINIDNLKLQYEEVAAAKWVKESEIIELVKKGEFIEHPYLDRLFKIVLDKT